MDDYNRGGHSKYSMKVHIKKEQLKRDIKVLKKQWYIILLFLALLLFFQYKFHNLCTVRALTGFPCPACGMTRAFVLFFRGHIRESLGMHPLWPFVLFLGIFSLERRYIEGGKKYLEYLYYAYIILLVMALVCLYFYRMYEYFPYQEPMIYDMDNALLRMGKG